MRPTITRRGALFLLVLLSAGAPAQAVVVPLSAELSIGREAAQYIEGAFPLSKDPMLLARVQRIGRRIAGVCDQPELPFEFHVVDTPDINAFCLPGGYVYVFRGLLQGIPNDDALAFILAHEIAHAVERHALSQFEKSQLVRIVLTPLGPLAGTFARDLTNVIIQKKFSRDDESEADRCGLRYTVRAGFSPDSGVRAMDTLLQLGGKRRHPEFLMDHPDTKRRKEAMVQLAAEMKQTLPVVAAAAPAVLPEPLWLAPPPGLKRTPHFPLAAGHTWTYRVSDGSGRSTKAVVRVIEGVPGELPGVFRVETAYEGDMVACQLVRADDSAVQSRPAAGSGGGRWQVDWRLEPDTEFAVSEAAAVVVPAGRFECRQVRRLASDGSVVAEGWFADGVGLVKCRWPSLGVTQELVSYQIAERR